jgi:hypothetical protein
MIGLNNRPCNVYWYKIQYSYHNAWLIIKTMYMYSHYWFLKIIFDHFDDGIFQSGSQWPVSDIPCKLNLCTNLNQYNITIQALYHSIWNSISNGNYVQVRLHGGWFLRMCFVLFLHFVHQTPYTYPKVLGTTLHDKVCQWLAAGRWFSTGTSVYSTNKTDRYDITNILLKVALNTISLSLAPTP